METQTAIDDVPMGCFAKIPLEIPGVDHYLRGIKPYDNVMMENPGLDDIYFLAKDGHPLGFAIFVFDRAQRAVLDATMNPGVPESTPAARAWIRRALQVDQVLLADWMKTY